MSTTDSEPGKNGGIKTIAFRFRPDLHAQLTLIAQLRGRSLQDEVVTALEAHLKLAKTDPDLQQRVTAAQEAIEQDAQERRNTIAALFASGESDPSSTPAKTAPAKATSRPAGGKPIR